MTTMKTNRRTFLKRTALAGRATTGLPTLVPSTVFGANAPNNRIGVGIIGLGLIHSGHRRYMCGRPDVQVLAVCDVDRRKREAIQGAVNKAYARRQDVSNYRGCDAYLEFEKIIQRPDIDAVIVTTPDHWHAPISVMARRHCKDVYVQKPMTLTLRDGRIMSDVQRQYSAKLQVGFQQRSERGFRNAW